MSVLTKKKTKEDYRKLFSKADAIMREKFSQDIKLLDVKLITIDFELAFIGAVDEYWPEAKKQGCFVHFLRAQVNNLRGLVLEAKKKKEQLSTYYSNEQFSIYRRIKNCQSFRSNKKSNMFCGLQQIL